MAFFFLGGGGGGIWLLSYCEGPRVVFATIVAVFNPPLVSMLFADLLSLHLVTFLMFFILVLKKYLGARQQMPLLPCHGAAGGSPERGRGML